MYCLGHGMQSIDEDAVTGFLQAADIVRIVGIGRNEYIATMNKCKAKKLLWRMNKAVVKEHLPTEPLEFNKQPWWIAHVVNLGESGGNIGLNHPNAMGSSEWRLLMPEASLASASVRRQSSGLRCGRGHNNSCSYCL